tara:strand:+ start:1379 stop:1729 length:351 start_codon:yes stop_codon:yes gene_type:complete
MKTPKKYPEHASVQTILHLPGRIRNELVDHVQSLGTTMNEWCGIVIRKALEEEQGLPAPPPAAAPIPTKVDILRQYLTGDQVLEPCGKPYPCERETTDPEFHGQLEFCGHCRIMVQ